MRARKVILLVCADTQRRSELRLILDINMYRVTEDLNRVADMKLTVNKNRRDFRVSMPDTCPHLVMGKDGDTATLLEMVKAMCARKRGPKTATEMFADR
jgi:hypothetical protein